MPKRKSFRLMIALAVACLSIPHASAKEEFWAKKPYQNWSAEEIAHLLQESPWAVTEPVTGVQTAVSSGGSALGGEMEVNPSVTYTLQFRSAKPIREAQIRSSQLSSHYDAMTAEQKAAFDANAAKFLAVSFADRIVVSVTFHCNVQNFDSLFRNYWDRQSLATQSQTTYLNTSAEKVPLMAYTVKEDTFQLTFARPKGLPAEGKISVEFVSPRINVMDQQRMLLEFNLKKMVINGEPAL